MLIYSSVDGQGLLPPFGYCEWCLYKRRCVSSWFTFSKGMWRNWRRNSRVPEGESIILFLPSLTKLPRKRERDRGGLRQWDSRGFRDGCQKVEVPGGEGSPSCHTCPRVLPLGEELEGAKRDHWTESKAKGKNRQRMGQDHDALQQGQSIPYHPEPGRKE